MHSILGYIAAIADEEQVRGRGYEGQKVLKYIRFVSENVVFLSVACVRVCFHPPGEQVGSVGPL